MRRFLLPLAVLPVLAAVGPCYQWPETRQGVKIEGDVPGLPSLEEHERALDAFLEVFEPHFPEARGAVADSRIEWWDRVAVHPDGTLDMAVVWGGQAYHGLAWPGGLCQVAWRGRISRTALAHELAHQVLFRAPGWDGDHDHAHPRAWALVEVVNARLAAEGL